MGGGGRTTSGYTYQAAVMIGLCAGPIQGIGTVWNDKTCVTLASLNLSAALGAPGQATWGYLATRHAGEAVPYSGLAHVDCPLFQLDSNAGVPNLSFEVIGHGQLDGHVDAMPDYILADFLAQAGFPAENIGDFSASGYSAYCQAAGLLLSPALTEQAEGSGFLVELAQCTNSEYLWSQGKLTIIPYADAEVSGNGATFTPSLVPIYDLTDDDFIVSDASDAPISVSRITTADAYNHVQVEYVDRAQDYNVAVAEAKDQADIEAKGLRTQDPITLHHICDATVARNVAQLLLQRTLYIRNTYTFKLSWNYCLLEPLDLVTLTDATLGLNQAPVRITQIDEDEDGLLTVTAEEYPFGVNSHALYPHQDQSGYVPNHQVDPGNVNDPVIFEAPYQLTAGGNELWIGLSGGENWGGADIYVSDDNLSYKRIGAIDSPARQGVLSALLASHTDPDTADTLSVDLTESRGSLSSGTQADADNYNTLCYVDGELISYQAASLTDSNKYNLTYLRRGVYGTPISAHSAGSKFCRLDEAVAKYAYSPDSVGKTVYLKFVSFNVYGQAYQELSDVTAYSHSVNESPVPADVTGFSASVQLGKIVLNWDENTEQSLTYDIQIGSAWGAGGYTSVVTNHSGKSYTWTPDRTGTVTFWIKGRNAHGVYSVNASGVTVTVGIPDAPTAISCTPILCGVDVAITYPASPVIDYCEVWASTTNNRANAACIGVTRNGKFQHQGLASAAVRYYWARTMSVFAQSSTWFPVSTTAGVQGTTLVSPSELLSLLHSSVTTDALIADLQALFLTGNINGVPTLGLDGSMVIDGSLTADAIAANQLIVGENVAMGANATITWANVTGTGKPASNATVGAPAGTYVGTALAETLVSDTATAKTNAASALTSIANIAADSKLTPVEKSQVRADWDTIYSEKTALDTQATSLGITTEKTALGTAYTSLGNYLNAGVAYTPSATPPSWITDANLSATTDIVGATFRSTFKAYYDAKIALLNKMAAVAATKADWASISSKPTVYTETDIRNFATNITDTRVTTAFVNALNVTANSVNASWVYAGTLTAAQVNATGFTANNANIGAYICSTNFNGSTTDPYGTPGTAGWCIAKSGGAAFNNVRVRGDIQATSVSANSITTNHLVSNAATSMAYGWTPAAGPSALVTGTVYALTQCSISVYGGLPIVIEAEYCAEAYCANSGVSMVISIAKGSASSPLISRLDYLISNGSGPPYVLNGTRSIRFVDIPSSAGTYTYYVTLQVNGSVNTSSGVYNKYIRATEYRR